LSATFLINIDEKELTLLVVSLETQSTVAGLFICNLTFVFVIWEEQFFLVQFLFLEVTWINKNAFFHN
jgi:hypothetical protein